MESAFLTAAYSVCIWGAFLFLVESKSSLLSRKERFRRLTFHFSLYGFNLALCFLVLGFLPLLRFPQAYAHPQSLIKSILVVLGLDLLSYTVHRLFHVVPFLWRLHQVHHSDSVLDMSSAFREHFGQTFLLLGVSVFGIELFQASAAEFYSYVFLSWMTSLFAHSGGRYGEFPLLSWLLVTPTFHAVHHEQFGNTNFGAVFSVWDRVFGSCSKPEVIPRTAPSDVLTTRHVLWAPFLSLALALSGCTGRTRYSLEPVSPQLQKEISYGKELFVHTARYLGPLGSVYRTKSRLNCQNCHLDAGTRRYGIYLGSAFGRYPEYKAREGIVVTLSERINDCFERAMNGNRIPAESREMRALEAYLFFLGRGLPVATRETGDRVSDILELPKRAADPLRGRRLYETQCVSCHGLDGLGKLDVTGVEYEYPPLWGKESFNAGSNMHRVTKLAAFIRANMPFGVLAGKPKLTSEEALDVAAYINDDTLHFRPKSPGNEYPLVSEKPIDYPRGPYQDPFSEKQHALGPFAPILEYLHANKLAAYY